jgi:hypothetical protein
MLMAAQAAAAPAASATAEPAQASAESSAETVTPFGPPAPLKPKRKAPGAAPAPTCQNALPTEPGEIVVCAERPQGYRIDPDILQAGRDKRSGRKPKPPERMADNSCQVVGPMGCANGSAINLVQAVVGAATMLKKAVNGENVGKMFITTPEPTDYELYLEAKRRREAAEAEAPAVAEASADDSN